MSGGLAASFGPTDLDALLAGDDRGADAVVTWLRDLDEPARASLTALASAELVSLEQSLGELADTLDPESAVWRSELRGLLVRRDDLEAAYQVLRDLGSARQLGAGLTAFDERGLAFLRACPTQITVSHPRLGAVRRLEVEAWWASFAM